MVSSKLTVLPNEKLSFYLAEMGRTTTRSKRRDAVQTAVTGANPSLSASTCNCATKRRRVGSRPSCAMVADRRRDRTRPRPWTSSSISWPRVATFGAYHCRRLLPLCRRWSHGFTFRSTDVVEILQRVCKEVGSASIKAPSCVARSRPVGLSARCHAQLFTARKANQCLQRSIQWALPGGCLNAHWFLSLADAQKKVEDWRRYYSEERPPDRSAISRRDGAASPPA